MYSTLYYIVYIVHICCCNCKDKPHLCLIMYNKIRADLWLPLDCLTVGHVPLLQKSTIKEKSVSAA
jgi:hypothetical protein